MNRRPKSAIFCGLDLPAALLFVLACLLPSNALAQAPPWHELPVGAPVHDLVLDENGEGWIAAWDGANLSLHSLSFPETGRLTAGPANHTRSSNWAPRISQGDGFVLVTDASGILRWDGSVEVLFPTLVPTIDVRVDGLDPSFAVAMPNAGNPTTQVYLSEDGGLNWLAGPVNTGADFLAAAAAYAGRVTLFNFYFEQPYVSLDRSSWTPLPIVVEIRDTALLANGDLVGVGIYGDYVIGPVGQDLVLDQLDPELHNFRVASDGAAVFVLFGQLDGSFGVFEVPTPSSPAVRDSLPPNGLVAARALGASPSGRLVLSGTAAGGEVLLWRNRAPILHPGHVPPELIEGSAGGVMVELALDPDGDPPSILFESCTLEALTPRTLSISPSGTAPEGELFVAIELTGLEADDCPGLVGWPLHCSFEVTDGEQTSVLQIDGLAQSPGPTIAGLSPPSQAVETGTEVTVAIDGLMGCRIASVTAEVLEGGTSVLFDPDVQGESFSFIPWTNAAGAPAELTVVIRAMDEDGRVAEATASVGVSAPVLTVSAPSLQVVYGEATPPLEPTYQGFVGADGPADLATPPTCALANGEGVQAGAYQVECAGGADPRYTFVYRAGTLTVDRAPLTITAVDQTKTFGELLVFDGTEAEIVGLVGVETITGVTLFSEGAAADAAAGTYPIEVGQAQPGPGTELSNYQPTYHPGVLTVLHRIPVLDRCERRLDVPYGLVAVLEEGSAPAHAFHWLVELGDDGPGEEVTTSPELVLSPDRCSHGRTILASVTPSSLDGLPGEAVACEEMEIVHDGLPPGIAGLEEARTMLLGTAGGSLMLEAEVEDCLGEPVTVTWRLLDSIQGLDLVDLGEDSAQGDVFAETRAPDDPFSVGLRVAEEWADQLLEERVFVEVVAGSAGGGDSVPRIVEIDFRLESDLGEIISVHVDLFAPSARRVAPGELFTVMGHVTAGAPFALPGVAVALGGGASVVPGTLRVFDDCALSYPLQGDGRAPSAGLDQAAAVLEIGAVSTTCRGISFLARQGLGPPSLFVEACTWTTPEGSMVPISDCTGELRTRTESVLGCSCETPAGGGPAGGTGLALIGLLIVLCFCPRRPAA